MVTLLNRLLDRLRGRGPAEDVEPDPNLANARETGGAGAQGGDAPSTTGTGPAGTHVGRVSGSDEGAGETGAEVRGDRDDGPAR
ncbi:hypothetical protein H7X46_15555 [Pseudonocardia sp. C8]|uniref:hypothetical protein n=1 Tax=Pseudonocardia sp. C8 TaxID=2762759 RepID=UPI0016427E8D|nr:hypothetical protein [Pseudonocardia sp. C8]MBC3192481.1 hypothetical protein [Pseudonocardia sp. C8]